MITRLDEALRALLRASGARAAVIWSQHTQPRRAVVVCSCPLDLLAADTALPLPDQLPTGIQRDPARLAAVIPTTVRVRLLPDAPTAAESFVLDGADLVLQLIWCSPLVIDGIGTDLRLLITEQIGPLAREVYTGQQGVSDAGRHLAVIDGLHEGVVSVDFGLGVAEVNRAAARMLNLYHGAIPAADFADAMEKLMNAATNRAEIAAENAVILHDGAIPAGVIWRFPTPPTHLRVTSSTVAGNDFEGRIWSFTDESELCKALEANEAAARQARATADAMIDAQVLVTPVRDGGGRIVDFTYEAVNRAASEYLAMSRGQLVGATLTETFPNVNGSGLMTHYIRCAETGEPVVLDEFLYYNEILQDARRYDIRVTRAKADGTLSMTWRDVTERTEAAARIAASEEQYRLLAENSADIVCHLRDGRIVWVSPSVNEVMGEPAEAWTGRSVMDFVPPEDLSANLERMAKAETTGVESRIRVVAVDGAVHWLLLKSRPYLDANGRHDGVAASLRLIDDEVAAEHAAEEARVQRARADALYRRSMESAAVGMCLADVEGNFVDVNPAICEFFGYDADTLKKMTWLELTATDYLQADLGNREEVLEGRSESYRMVKQFIHADGRPIWGDLAVSCVRAPDGQVEVFIGQIIDITEEVEGRAKLQEAQRQQARIDERYRRSIDNAAVGMCLLTPQGFTTDVNSAMCDFFGVTADELIGKHWRDVTEPEYVDEEQRNWDGIVEGRIDSYRMLKHYDLADGRTVWGDVSVSGVLDDNGDLEYLVALVTDITAEVEARELLKSRSEENVLLAQTLARQGERVASDLLSAAAYVESILPAGLDGPVHVASRYLPSRELAGDCFDYRWIDEDHLIVYLLDVSGHGIEPALLSISVHNMLRSGSLPREILLVPDEVLAELNRRFKMDDHSEHYFTMWFGVYEASTRTLRYASAGAPPALVLTAGATPVSELSTKCPPVGMFDDTVFTSSIYFVPPGGRILLYSDGAFELLLGDGRQLSLEEFEILISRYASTQGSTLDVVIEELRALATSRNFTDDCSLIELTFH